MSIANEAMIEAFNRGYRVWEGGIAVSPTNKLLKPYKSGSGFLQFGIVYKGMPRNVSLHRMLLFQEYGNAMLDSVIEFKDGDKTKITFANLQITDRKMMQRDGNPHYWKIEEKEKIKRLYKVGVAPRNMNVEGRTTRAVSKMLWRMQKDEGIHFWD